MKYSIREVTISPPGELITKKGFGWAKVFIHLNDETIETFPSVTLQISVPYSEDHTFKQAREAAHQRAREMLKTALAHLEATSLAEIDNKT